jgi:hypothetical protein
MAFNKNSIVDYLDSQWQDSSRSARKKLAAQYGIKNYNFLWPQNLELLKKMRETAPSKDTAKDTTLAPKDTIWVADQTWEQQNAKTLKTIQDKYNLNRLPTKKDIEYFKDTWDFDKWLYTKDIWDKSKGNSTDVIEDVTIYWKRDEYLKNYIWALEESFDESTWLKLQEYWEAKTDYETDIQYYRQDFEKITSRKNQDYFKWIALQNKDFSKSLDYVANLWAKTIWALEWFWRSRIVEATGEKIEQDVRYKLDFDRTMEDLSIWKERKEARYKLDLERLAQSKAQFEKARETEKRVWTIEATWDIARYYDTLITGKTLSEDEAAKRRKEIEWWWTGIENIYNF